MNKRQNSFSGFENKARSLYDKSFERMDTNDCTNADAEQIITRKHVSDSQMSAILDRRHLEDLTNHQQEPQHQSSSQQQWSHEARKPLIIDDALNKLDPVRS